MTPALPAGLDRRGSAGSAAQQALALYRAIFMKSTEAIAILDTSGLYLEQNAAHRELLGYDDDELRGLTPAVHLGEEQFSEIAGELRRVGVCRRECRSRAKDGRLLTIALSSFAVHDAAGAPVCYVGVKRDVTAEKAAAAELRQKFDELQAIYRMADTVGRARALPEIYEAALDELQRTLRADRASVLLLDPDGVMRFKAWRGLSDAYRTAVEGHSPWSADDPDPQPVLVPDVREDAHLAAFSATFAAENVRALAFIPLLDGGRLLGKFMLYFDRPHRMTPAALQLAQTIARHIAFAISRTRSEEALRESERTQRFLAEAGALLNSSLDYGETLCAITELAVPAIADWCMVDLVAPDGSFERIAVATSDRSAGELARDFQRRYHALPDVPHGVTRVVSTGRPELMAEVHDGVLRLLARDPAHLALLRGMRMNSYICAPLVTRGRITGVLTLAVSISGRRYTGADLALAEELARQAAVAVENARLYREVQQANRAKSDFLAMMSHELRTPLNAIAGYADLMQLGLRGPLTESQRADLARIQRSQQHLLGLINGLLSYARLETGHLELHAEAVDLEDALEGAQALVEPQMAAKNLRYQRMRGDPRVRCRADREKLQQVLVNLLSNAVKFTEPGGAVTLAWDADADSVRIHVRDTGPGIPAEKLEAIFEPFVQLSTSLGRVTEGTGLGLAISRQLARAMGGDVAVRSVVGEGSTFTVSLPVA